MQPGVSYSKPDVARHRLQQPKAVIGEEIRFPVGKHNCTAYFSAYIKGVAISDCEQVASMSFEEGPGVFK